MQCINPVFIRKNLDPSKYPDGLEVPCGKCIACRIQKRKEWTVRLMHELDSWDRSSFITLTYSDDNLPENMSLKKSDLQKFFKRLRKSLEKTDRKIRYFACGEYGDTTQRPHYHLILFGIGINYEDRKLVMDNWPYCDWNNSHIRRKSFGLVEPDSVRYVAQYVDKKFTGDLAQREYTDKNREPVFRILSLGIGRSWCDLNSDQIRQQLHLTYRGIPMSLPRYYLNRLNIDSSFRKDDAIKKDYKLVKKYTGIDDVTRDMLYKFGPWSDSQRLERSLHNAKKQHEKNLYAKSNLKNQKL